MPAASLGHYASLSFGVIGRRRNWEFRELEGFEMWDVNKDIKGFQIFDAQ